MKKYCILVVWCIYSVVSFAQQKNPTTVKEIKDKQKQAQQALDGLTPEQRKMMDEMGIKFPAANGSLPAGTTDTQVALAVGGDGVPTKNAVLIGSIPKITLTAATLPAYIKTLNEYVEKSVAADAKSFGLQVYNSFKSNKYDAASTGNGALGFWATGNLEIAVFIMGRTSADDPSDADLLSNFAAMLSMGGAPQRAIPLLEYLNKLYPDNTTILNNLGQAWFYLGETDKADVQLEKVVRAFAYHPQANYTQCLIQQSKGNTSKAIDKLQHSLKYSFSQDKINLLRKLGYKMKGSDMRIPFRPDPNPLGLRNFVRPEAPVSLATEIPLKVEWDAFQNQLDEKNMELSKAMQPYINQNAQQAQQLLKTGKGGASTLSENIYQSNADIHLNELNKDGGTGYRLKIAKAKIDSLFKDYQTKKDAQKKIIIKQNSSEAAEETELAKKGENIGYDVCVVERKFSDWVYANYNKPLEEAYQNYLHQLYLKITEELYWKQFKYTDAAFEQEKLTAKKEWLSALRSTRYIETWGGSSNCAMQEKKEAHYRLTDFDDMHCAFKTSLDFICCKQIFECGKSRIEFDAGRFSGNFNFKFDDNGNNKFVKGTLEATVIDKSISVGKGPLQAGASVKAGMGVEFSSHGIDDVYATGEASVNVGSNTVSDPAGVVNDPSVNISVSGRMSLISGNMSGAISGFNK